MKTQDLMMAIAAILSGDVFNKCVEDLDAMREDVGAPRGYQQPTTGRLQGAFEKQGIPAMPHTPDLLVSERFFIEKHLEQALCAESPIAMGRFAAADDLKAAVTWVSSFRSNPAALAASRAAKRTMVHSIRGRLAGHDRQLDRLRTPASRSLAISAGSIATIAAFMRAMDWPDTLFTVCQLIGFPAIGNYPRTGIFREVERPATHTFGELHHPPHNLRVEKNLRSIGARADARTREELEQITRKTRAAVGKGYEFGPFTSDEVDGRLGAGKWRALQAFGICQGTNSDGKPKWRRCDNAKASLTNACLSTHETLSCEDASFPCLVAYLFGAVSPGDIPSMSICTDDVEMAYRRMVCEHPEATVVAIYDTVLGDVAYYTMPGHNFGLSAAVLSWNRHTQLTACIARRFFGCCVGGYFDDFCTAEPCYAAPTGKTCLRLIQRTLHIPLVEGDDCKDIPFRPSNPFLGVITDLSRVAQGIVVMRPKPERIARIVVAIEIALESGAVQCAWLNTLCGKLEFVCWSSGYSRLGRAAIAIIHAWVAARRYAKERRSADGGYTIDGELRAALLFFMQLLPMLKPRVFNLYRKRKPAIVVYTDAMYAAGSEVPARIGVVIYDPLDPEAKWRHASASVPAWLMAKFAKREQYIGVLETLAGVAAYTSRPRQFKDRDVIHFVDNVGSLVGLAKGYSRDLDSGRLVHIFHAIAAASSTNVWFEYVPSAANIADLPSRDELELLLSKGSVPFAVKWPSLEAAWEQSLDSFFIKFSAKPSRADLRRLHQLEELIEAERINMQ